MSVYFGDVKVAGACIKTTDIINVRDFGVTGTAGDTNVTYKFQQAVNAAAGRTLYVPQGTYILDTINIHAVENSAFMAGIRIVGDGMFSTRIYSASLTGNIFDVETGGQVVFENISFNTTYDASAGGSSSTRRTAGAFLSLAGDSTKSINGGVIIMPMVLNCFFGLGFNAIVLRDAMCAIVDGCYVYDCFNGVYFNAVANRDYGDSTITRCVMSNTYDDSKGSSNDSIAINQTSSGGLRVIDNKIYGFGYSYVGSFKKGLDTSSAQGTGILLVEGNSFEYARKASIMFMPVEEGTHVDTFCDIIIVGNQITCYHDAYGIIFSNKVQDVDYVNDVLIGGNEITVNGTNSSGILLNHASNVSVLPNLYLIVYTSSESPGYSVYIGEDASNVTIHNQGSVGQPRVYVDQNAAQKVKFVSVKETGYVDSTGVVTSTEYGNFWITPVITVKFANSFPVVPTVTIQLGTSKNNPIAAMVESVTTSEFTCRIVALTKDAAIAATYTAVA